MPPSYRIKPKGPLAEGEPISLDNLGKFMSGSDLLHLAIKAIRLERIELNSYPKQPETNVDLQFEYNDFGRLEREEERARMLQPVRKPQVTEPGNLFTAKKWNELFPKDLRLKESIVVNNSFDFTLPDSTFPYTDLPYQVTPGKPIDLKGFLARLEAARIRDIEFAQNVAASDLLSQVYVVLERYGLEVNDKNLKEVLAKSVTFHEQSKGKDKGKRSINLA